MTRRAHPTERTRQRINKQSRDLSCMFGPVLRAIGDQVVTTAEVVDQLPQLRPKDVRKVLLILHDDGVLTRVTMPDAVLYARRTTES